MAEHDRVTGYRKVEHVNRAGELQGAVLAGANLQRSKLSGVMATRADFTDAIMRDCKLVRANLKLANMSGADLAGADLSGADLTGADLEGAVLIGAKTTLWNVAKANLTGVLTDKPVGTAVMDMPYQDMLQAHALWCETGGVEGAPSTFDGADLRQLKSVRGLNLTALSAKGAIFYGVDLEGVQLQGAHLEGADLRGCNLRRADLRGARLKGAKLSAADLRDAPTQPADDRRRPSAARGPAGRDHEGVRPFRRGSASGEPRGSRPPTRQLLRCPDPRDGRDRREPHRGAQPVADLLGLKDLPRERGRSGQIKPQLPSRSGRRPSGAEVAISMRRGLRASGSSRLSEMDSRPSLRLASVTTT